jgi:hypothetical protein
MTFEAFQSFFVIFHRNDSAKALVPAHGVNFPKAVPVKTLEGSWDVAFDPKWGGPAKVVFPVLQDWTEHPEDGVRHYSGLATYRKSFEAPNLSGKRAYLDLGTVHEIAEVTLNGKKLGVVWCAPWRIEMTKALKSGENNVEIRVANTWRNRLLGDASKPEAERVTRTALRYKASGGLKPSGLLGPVQIAVEDDM